MTRDDPRWKRIHVVSLAVSRHIHRSGIQRSNVESVSSRAERFPSDGALGPSQKRLLIFPRRKRRRFVRKHLVSPSYGSLQIRSFPFFLPSPAALFPFLPSFLPLPIVQQQQCRLCLHLCVRCYVYTRECTD